MSDQNNLEKSNQETLEKARKAIEFLGAVKEAKKSEKGIAESKRKNRDSTFPIHQNSNGGYPTETVERIGRFELIKELGEGGFAQVFLANDPNLDRHVALKVPKPHTILSVESRERFVREAKAAGMLSHPAIVPVFECDSIGPLAFIAYEYCSGKTLSQWIADRSDPLSGELAAKMVSRLAEAVEHAHQRGVIHRDLKPSNIMVDENQGDELALQLRITDFGLARHVFEVDSKLTTEGAIVGTPAYMSPEQAMGKKEIGKASDVYSLGVILYELLSGKPPHLCDSAMETLRSVESVEPEPLRKHRAGLSKDLEAICTKCLEKNPNQRYLSAFELSADLNRFNLGLPIHARRVSSIGRLNRWMQRNPAIAAAVSFAFLSLAIGLALTTWKWLESNRNYAQAEKAKNSSEESFALAQSTVEDLVNKAARDPVMSGKNREAFVLRSVELQEKLLEKSPNNTVTIKKTWRAYIALAWMQIDHGNIEGARESLTRAEELGRLFNHDSTTNQHDSFPNVEYAQNQIRSVIARQSRTLVSLSPVQVSSEPETVKELAGLSFKFEVSSTAYNDARKHKRALSEALRGLTYSRRIEEPNVFQSDMRARLLLAAGFAYEDLSQWNQAVEKFREAAEVFESVAKQIPGHGNRHGNPFVAENIARSHRHLGNSLAKTGVIEESNEHLSTALSIFDQLVASEPKNSRMRRHLLRTHKFLAINCIEQKRNQDLQVHLDRIAELSEQMTVEFESQPFSILAVTLARLEIAEYYFETGQIEKCREQVDLVPEQVRSIEENDPLEFHQIQSRMANMLSAN